MVQWFAGDGGKTVVEALLGLDGPSGNDHTRAPAANVARLERRLTQVP